MIVKNARLCLDDGTPVRFVQSPNVGGKVDPRYLIMRYTVGPAEPSIKWLCNPAAKASAHLVIARDGAITQLVPLDQVAWHAGKSQWQGLVGLNSYSIGIELENAGPLMRVNGQWTAWKGATVPDAEVIEAAHKNGGGVSGWQTYTSVQIDAAIAAGRAIAAAFEMFDVIGHDDVAPSRKRDPGPAFPLASFEAAVLGRADDKLERLEATTGVFLRVGPGKTFDKARPMALAKGTLMDLRGREGAWCDVTVLGKGGKAIADGWVHGDYARRVA